MSNVKVAEYSRNCEIKPGMVFPDNMYRVALGVEYDGSQLKGFQKQTSASNTVQEALEKALSFVADEEIILVCAGRTDAGVHGTGQVVHFDTQARRPEKAWIHGVNTHLPDCVRVQWSREVPEQFHARFSALSRRYRYILYPNPTRPAVLNKQVTHITDMLNVEKMNQAAGYLVGEQDFSSFRAAQCQAAHAVRCIHFARVSRHGAFVVLDIQANAFLYHMVRNITGALLAVGKGKYEPQWIQQLLQEQDRKLAPPTAPAYGLYLISVAYPEHFDLPEVVPGPFFLGL